MATNLSFFLTFPKFLIVSEKGKSSKYCFRPIIVWTIYGPDNGQAGTINFAFLWFQADHRLDHICPEYGQPGTINLYGPEYDQPGIILYDGRVWLTCFCMGGKPGNASCFWPARFFTSGVGAMVKKQLFDRDELATQWYQKPEMTDKFPPKCKFKITA